MINKPLVKIQDLTGDEKEFILLIIRNLSKPLIKEFGADCAEEALISLVDTGILKITTDGEENFWLEKYNTIKDEYERI